MSGIKTGRLLGLLSLFIVGCAGTGSEPALVIWVTGGLQSEWLPYGDYGQVSTGGLSRISRALELYRQPGDLLVDLGRFRYLRAVTGQTREWRIRADGFMKSLARMNYSGLNASLADLPPWPPELADLAEQFGLPLVSCGVGQDSLLFLPFVEKVYGAGKIRIYGLTGGSGEFSGWIRTTCPASQRDTSDSAFNILVADAPEEKIKSACDSLGAVDLILWLNAGKPVAEQMGGVPVLGMGDQGNCLGRIEIRRAGERSLKLEDCDLSGWLDQKPYRHQPARESLLDEWLFWRTKPMLRAYLWEAPESLSPQKDAETQRKLTDQEVQHLYDLEDIHRQTPNGFAGLKRCLDCHSVSHSRNLTQEHLVSRQEVRDYPVYERCLPCHATGFDDPGGFLLPWERPDLLTVTCEACHEDSYQHASKGEAPCPPIPGESSCQPCHEQKSLPPHHP